MTDSHLFANRSELVRITARARPIRDSHTLKGANHSNRSARLIRGEVKSEDGRKKKEGSEMGQQEQESRADRLSVVVQSDLQPDSLVGSFFHSDVERGWQGCVVAEPAQGVYLLELFDWVFGSSEDQRLVRIEEMVGWRFYDDAKWMKASYDLGVRQEWARTREQASEVGGLERITDAD